MKKAKKSVITGQKRGTQPPLILLDNLGMDCVDAKFPPNLIPSLKSVEFRPNFRFKVNLRDLIQSPFSAADRSRMDDK